MKTKQILYKKCEAFLNRRFSVIQKTIDDIQGALQSETKSSAGDKHETGRAMLQLEREKARQQLAELQKLQETLHKIDVEMEHQNVALGSIVFTTKLNYFIAISAGEIEVENRKFYAISASTPIAKLLMSRQIGDAIKFRDIEFLIKAIK
ncbi:3-oxoacyl-ACP synthase [Winogradskyella immobilis]|uniref:3-oxoacyl-ACP synthase n=1 Tax=Winogradskyella immobilis TaxID=2816852 RepID=A0ABS8EJS2_9FLAO|nr:3-oxoacyl-ACP synthase [Winogradskyella immobilis]MCC1483403.1 3-oxoacyl-ACP synthase [Winogradskyella immobilis]MCG0015497.1 3-oxoacyl-ACP synthase [Winogradskyella immobilis]